MRPTLTLLLVTVLASASGRGMAGEMPPPAAAATAPDRGPGAGGGAAVAVAAEQADFDLRSSFWVNLHHFLYLQAVLAAPGVHQGRAEIAARDAAGAPSAMSAGQKAAWDKAVGYYARGLGERGELSNPLLVANYQLAAAGDGASLAGRPLPAGMAAVLEAAAPIYRELWWQRHDELNRRWIAAAAQVVRRYGNIGPRIAALYETEWPREKTLVEVVPYANFGGAYTMIEPTLITISSVDPGNQGDATLETLFHEASHGLVATLGQQLDSRLRKAGKTPTFQLVHVIIFYTAGAVAAEALAKNGVREYVPYAVKEGLYTRVPGWAHYQDICARDWQPHIDGKIDLDEALARITRDF